MFGLKGKIIAGILFSLLGLPLGYCVAEIYHYNNSSSYLFVIFAGLLNGVGLFKRWLHTPQARDLIGTITECVGMGIMIGIGVAFQSHRIALTLALAGTYFGVVGFVFYTHRHLHNGPPS